jgi:hypothetical protein
MEDQLGSSLIKPCPTKFGSFKDFIYLSMILLHTKLENDVNLKYTHQLVE